MQTLKEQTLKIYQVHELLVKFGLAEYLTDMTKEQTQKALDILDFEEHQGEYQSVQFTLIGVFYEGKYLAARLFKDDGENAIQSKEHYDKIKSQIQSLKG